MSDEERKVSKELKDIRLRQRDLKGHIEEMHTDIHEIKDSIRSMQTLQEGFLSVLAGIITQTKKRTPEEDLTKITTLKSMLPPRLTSVECSECNTFRCVKQPHEFTETFTCAELRDPERECRMPEYKIGCKVVFNDTTYIVTVIDEEARKLTLQRSLFGKASLVQADEDDVRLYIH